jgi:hypothetical protein
MNFVVSCAVYHALSRALELQSQFHKDLIPRKRMLADLQTELASVVEKVHAQRGTTLPEVLELSAGMFFFLIADIPLVAQMLIGSYNCLVSPQCHRRR